MGAYYSFELNSIKTYAPQFFGHNALFLRSVYPISYIMHIQTYINLNYKLILVAAQN